MLEVRVHASVRIADDQCTHSALPKILQPLAAADVVSVTGLP